MREPIRQILNPTPSKPRKIWLSSDLVWLLAVLFACCSCQPQSDVQPPAVTSAGNTDKSAESTRPDAVSISKLEQATLIETVASPDVRVPLAQATIDWSESFGKQGKITSKQISDSLTTIFGPSPADLKPGVVVFPVTDENGVVRLDGLGLSQQALIAIAVASAQPQIAVYPDAVLYALIEAGCDRPGGVLTDELRVACLGTVNARVSVTAALIEQDSGWELQLAFTDVMGNLSGQPQRHAIPRGKLNLVPGIIAGDVCDRLQITLTAEERAQMLLPQVSTDEDSVVLTRLLNTQLYDYGDLVQMDRFLHANPRCLGAWRRMVNFHGDLYEAYRWYRNSKANLKDPRLEFHIAARMVQLGFAEKALSELQRLAGQLPGDVGVGLQLLQLSRNTGDMELVDQVFKAWRGHDQSYMARCARGKFLLELASHVRTISDPDHFPELASQKNGWLDAARTELVAAVDQHPTGWQARNLLISLATAQQRPREEMELHFKAAVAAAPGNVSSYRRKLQYLSPHYQGSIDDLATFAEECVRTRRWEDGIPQLVVEAVDLATCNPEDAATSYGAFRNERLWHAIQLYYAEANQQDLVADQRQAMNCFALWSTISGHGREAVELYQTLLGDSFPGIYDRAVFEAPVNFHFLNDLVRAAGDNESQKRSAAIRLALSEGDLDRVDRLLEETQGKLAPHQFAASANAVKLGRRLLADRKIEFSPEDLLNLLVITQSHSLDPDIDTSSFRTVIHAVDKGIHWNTGGNLANPKFYFPLGIRHGVVSGEVRFSGGIQSFGILLHTRALRDVVTVMYLPQERVGSVIRSRRQLETFAMPADLIPFRFEFGSQHDTLEPIPGSLIRTPVVDDVPSGFWFEGYGNPSGSGEITIANLKIELLD